MASPSLRLRSCACFSSSWRDAFCCWYLLAQRSFGAYWQHTALAKSRGLRRTSSAYSADRPMTWLQKQSRTLNLSPKHPQTLTQVSEFPALHRTRWTGLLGLPLHLRLRLPAAPLLRGPRALGEERRAAAAPPGVAAPARASAAPEEPGPSLHRKGKINITEKSDKVSLRKEQPPGRGNFRSCCWAKLQVWQALQFCLGTKAGDAASNSVGIGFAGVTARMKRVCDHV